MSGTYQMVWDGSKWAYNDTVACGGIGGTPGLRMSLQCVNGSWVFNASCGVSYNCNVTFFVCDPLEVHVQATGAGIESGYCCDNGGIPPISAFTGIISASTTAVNGKKVRISYQDWMVPGGVGAPSCEVADLCCDMPPTGCLDLLSQCDVVPFTYTFTLSGISGDAGIEANAVSGCSPCSDFPAGGCCSALNRTYVLTFGNPAASTLCYPDVGCSWQEVLSPFDSPICQCSSGLVYSIGLIACLHFDEGTSKWQLRIRLNPEFDSQNACADIAIYELDAASWNCLGSNTLAKVFDDTGFCGGTWPSTITINPL